MCPVLAKLKRLRNDREMRKAGTKAPRKPMVTLPTVSIRGMRQPALSDEFVVVRTRPLGASRRRPRSSEKAQTLIARIGKALKTPGIRRDAVFKREVTGLFAYSADPVNPKKIVRRSSAGKKVSGRLVQGRFRAG